jgi:hypothetical protein
MDTCLINTHKAGLERYKVVTRVGDREVLERIVEGKPPAAPAGSRLAGGVKFFTERIRSHVARDAAALERLKVAATARLSLVTITLEGENPYEIFESLNATGLPLEESDLIRNYLFMQVPLDKQEAFQDRRWSKLEQAFAGRKDARGVPTEFYRAFCMRGGTYSKQKQTYLDFRTEYQSSIDSPEAAVDQLVQFAKLDAWAGVPSVHRTERKPEILAAPPSGRSSLPHGTRSVGKADSRIVWIEVRFGRCSSASNRATDSPHDRACWRSSTFQRRSQTIRHSEKRVFGCPSAPVGGEVRSSCRVESFPARIRSSIGSRSGGRSWVNRRQ